jgi:energy-coupling factor transport system ATP-binding protein
VNYLIEIKNVSFSYENRKDIKSLEDVNLSIKSGEVILLCGTSGCGKTTLTRLINGLIPNFYEGILEGEVLVEGKEVSSKPLYETASKVGSVFQNPRSQFFNVDTTSELSFGCENMGFDIGEIKDRVNGTVFDFNIDSLMNRSIFQLSGGEKQKIACASVSALSPDVFVLDEPSSNLDFMAIEDLRKVIELWKSRGKTIVVAEHRLYYLSQLADRVIYMKNGRIESEFNRSEILKMSSDELGKLGLRPINLCDLKEKNIEATKCTADTINICEFSFGYKKKCCNLSIRDLDVPRDGIIAVIGQNGAGKSTFARCLCGLEKRAKGKINLNGKQMKSKERLKHCYMVMQDVNHQLFTESVLDEVLLGMPVQDEKKAEIILESLDLHDYKDAHPMALSGGQKQRVAIASAVASERDVILFDEPSSGLDFYHMKEVSENLRKLNSFGKTLFVVTHDPELILSCCNHVLEIDKGKVKANYRLDEHGKEKMLSFFI